jgi:quercetin dioxygenase-like cupin family protein
MKYKFRIDDEKPLKMSNGIDGMPVGLDELMVNLVSLKKDSVVTSHRHFEEQATFVFEGELDFELEGEKFKLGKGEGVIIPANANHSARAVANSLVYDCFAPPRFDYLEKLKPPIVKK